MSDTEKEPGSNEPTMGGEQQPPLPPTPSEQDLSSKAQSALEKEGLTDTERAYLSMIVEQGVGQEGELMQNPDGTYGPMNDRETEVVRETERVKPKGFNIGYQFKDRSAVATWRAPDNTHMTVTADQLTDTLAKRMLKEAPTEFRALMIRGYYEENDPYWK